jgi:hypothetical protein
MATTAELGKHVDNGAPAPRPSTPDALPPLERLSINRLLALYPRERLLVHPLRWTGRQLDLACRVYSRRADGPSHGHGADHDESGPGPGPSSGPTSCPRRLARLLATRLGGELAIDAAELVDTVARFVAPISPRPISIRIHTKYVGSEPTLPIPFSPFPIPSYLDPVVD